VPAHEPDETTGAARGGRAPGRHRHDQPGAATPEPAVDLPPPARPRHARGGEPSDPAATRRRYDDTGPQPVVPGGGSGYGADPRREAAYTGDADYSADYSANHSADHSANNSANNSDAYGTYSNDAYRDGGYDDWYGGDPEADSRSSHSRGAEPPWTTFRHDGRQGDSPHQDDPYRPDPYPDDRYDDPYADDPFADDPYTDPRTGDPYSGDPYQDDPRTGDRYQAAPDHTRRRGSDRYSAAGYGTDAYRADTYGPDTYSGDPYAGSNGSGAGRNGTSWDSPAPDATHAGPPDQDRYGVGPPAARSTAFGATDAEPEIATTGGRELRPGPDRRPLDQGPRGLPSRRPGEPPGVPAELFVETTAETPALRLDDEPPSPTPDASDATPERPRSGGRRILGVPVSVPVPAWARRLIPERQEHGQAHGQAHGHGHGHGPARPAGRRVRILIAALLVPCALATLVGVVLLWPSGGPPDTAQPVSQEPVRAQVTATRATDCSPGSGDGGCVALVVHMADGPRPDRDLVQVVPVEPGSPLFSVGDQVVLGWSGADPDDAGSYQVIDFQRGAPLAWLAGLFAAAVLLLGRWRGLAALVALALSFVVLLFFVVPAILAGHDPLAVAVVGACLIMFAVLYLTHGPSARTSTAVLGTLLSLALIGALSAAFSAAAQLTGLDDQTRNLIASLGTGVDARGLLLAGVVIGALGVLDDVTVTQTSAVWELRHANPEMSARGLFAAAMRIGRDHVASAVNTLVLAYAGAALPLLLLFSLSRQGFGNVVTSQDVATEVVRTLVGSIGLVASVPITTALAAAVAARETVPAAEKAG
jgi:uncharacterized membrane protein